MCGGLKSTADFRAAVASESNRLATLCSKWSKELDADAARETHVLSEDILGDINVAIGQAELLKKERFKQFCGLIDDCEQKRGEKETTIQDLQGFWEIIYFQVDDIQKKFSALDKLQSNNWQRETQAATIKCRPTKVVRPRPVMTSSKAASTSALRAHIMAARTKMTKLSVSISPIKDKDGPTAPVLVLHSSSPEQNSNEKENLPAGTNNQALADLPKHKGSRLDVENSSKDLNKSAKGILQISSSNSIVKSPLRTPTKKRENESQDDEPSKQQPLNVSPPVTTFDAGFFKVQTPSKSKVTKQLHSNSVLVTPSRSISGPGPDTKVLSSSLLKQRVRHTPLSHKDYSPCMRITRSMKKIYPTASHD